MQGIVRKPVPVVEEVDAPMWIRFVLGNAAAYGDFLTDLTRGINRCNDQIAEFLEKDDLSSANRMLGKREALREMRFMVEVYRKQAMEKEE